MSPIKRKLTFLIVVAAVAAGAAGAYAATQASSSSPRQAFFNDVARRLHVTPGALRRAMEGAFADRLAALVASGRLTKAQAKAIEQRVAGAGRYPGLGWFGAAGAGRFVHPGFGFGWHAYPPGPAGPPGKMVLPQLRQIRPGFMAPVPGLAVAPFPLFAGPGFGLLLPGGMRAALSYLGIHPAELMRELRSGRSLAQIAKAHGKSANGLESAISSAFSARLSRQVASGRLTKAQAGKILTAIRGNIARLMNVRLLPARFRRYRLPLPGLRRFQLVPHGAGAQRVQAGLAPA